MLFRSWINIQDGCGTIGVAKETLQTTIESFKGFELNVKGTIYVFRARPFVKAQRDLRCNLWVSEWYVPVEPAEAERVAKATIQGVLARNKLKGSFIKARLAKAKSGHGANLSWVPDRQLSETLWELKDSTNAIKNIRLPGSTKIGRAHV